MLITSTPKPGLSASLHFESESTLSSLTLDQVEHSSSNDTSQNYILDTPAESSESTNQESSDEIESDLEEISLVEEGYFCRFCNMNFILGTLIQHCNQQDHRIRRENFKQAQIQLNGQEGTKGNSNDVEDELEKEADKKDEASSTSFSCQPQSCINESTREDIN